MFDWVILSNCKRDVQFRIIVCVCVSVCVCVFNKRIDSHLNQCEEFISFLNVVNADRQNRHGSF